MSDETASSWESQLTDQDKALPFYQKVQGKPFQEVFRQAAETDKYAVGAIKIPNHDAPREEWDKVIEKLRPPSVEAYKMNLAQDIEWQGLDGLKPIAHKYGILPHQLEGLLNEGYAEYARQIKRDAETQLTNARLNLKKELGEAYETTLQKEKKVFDRLGIPEVFDAFMDSELGGQKKYHETFARIADLMSEDDLVEPGHITFKSPADIQREIEKIYKDPQDPFNNQNHPLHKARVKEVEQLWLSR